MTKKERSIAMTFNPVKFGNDLMVARLELRWTANEVSKAIGISQSMVSRYERAEESNPQMHTFLAFCNAYDLDPRNYFELEA